MKMTLQVVIEDEDHHHTPPIVKEVFSLERKSDDLCPETLGLKLDEAKTILAELQTERTAPEFAYLQTKWASVMSYGRTAELLEEVLPLEKRMSTVVLSGHV